MSTQSIIARKNLDGTFDSIYCHYDGYPEHHGNILLNYYNTPEKVDALMALGDLSSLGESIGCQHSFSNPPKHMCTAYGRDRGEENTNSKRHSSSYDISESVSNSWAAWTYLFDVKNNTWYYTRSPSAKWFESLKDEYKEFLLSQTRKN